MCTQCSTDKEAFIRMGNKIARTQNVEFRVVDMSLSIPCSNTHKDRQSLQERELSAFFMFVQRAVQYIMLQTEWLLIWIFQQVFLGYEPLTPSLAPTPLSRSQKYKAYERCTPSLILLPLTLSPCPPPQSDSPYTRSNRSSSPHTASHSRSPLRGAQVH